MKSEPAESTSVGCYKCNYTGFVQAKTQVRTHAHRNEKGEIVEVHDHYPHVAMCDCHPGR